MRLTRVVALAVLFSGTARAAEHDFPLAPRARDAEQRWSFSLSDRSGLVEAPFATSAFPQVSGFATLLTGSAALHVSSLGWLRLRLPLTYVRLDFPARAQVGEAALGNLELGLEHTLELRPTTQLGFLGAWLAPTASSGSAASLLNNRALALASALDGNRDASLLTPGVTGLQLGASLEHWHQPFDLRASLDVPILIRVSDADLPDETEKHPFGLLPALDLRVVWWAKNWFGASLGAALITEPLRVQEPTRDSDRARRLQPMLEPGVHFQLGPHVALGLQGSIPVAGALGGNAFGVDLGARLGF